MGMSHVSYIGLPQMGPTFITDEFFITPGMGRGCKTHHKIKGTRNYYFKTIGYLKTVLCNPAVGTNAWFKMLLPMPELYHAWVLVITLVLSTDVARSTMGLV